MKTKMRINPMCSIPLAVALIAGAAVCWGQSLKASVPFGFRINGMNLPPGDYSVSRVSSGSAPVLRISNFEARKSGFVMAVTELAGNADSRPRLVFHCVQHDCSLAEVWGATPGAGIALARPSRKSDDAAQTAVVYFKPKAEGR